MCPTWSVLSLTSTSHHQENLDLFPQTAGGKNRKSQNIKMKIGVLLENGNDIQCGEQVCVGEETQREVRGSSKLFAPPPSLAPHTLPIQVNTLNIDTPK